jgi:hypothetical protein
MTKRALQNALNDAMKLAKKDPTFFRLLVRDPARAMQTKKLDFPDEIREKLGKLLAESQFTVPDQRVLNIMRGDTKLTLMFPPDIIDWFMVPWSILYNQGNLNVKPSKGRQLR